MLKRLVARLAENILNDGRRNFENLLQKILEKESEVDHLALIADKEGVFALSEFQS